MSRGCTEQPAAHRDSGQVGVLIIGYTLLALLTVTVMAAASSVYIGQKKLLSAADGAAMAAADAFVLGESPGPAPAAVLQADSVRSAARAYLSDTGAGNRFTDLAVTEDTGTADARTARVVLTARVHPPIVNFLVPEGIPVTAVSEARARLVQ